MIDIKKLKFKYEDDYILKDISFHINENDSIGIVGANGVGKSTLLKILLGLNEYYEGTITIDNNILNKENIITIRKIIGYVFQDSNNQLFMSKVYDDIAFGIRNQGFNEDVVNKKVIDALNKVNILKLKDRYIHELSGGEKKLVAIATILAMNPKIIIMDEPTIALDPRNRKNLINILNDLNYTKIIASHDLDMILDTCKYTVLMYDGKIVKMGLSKDILFDKELLLNNGLELPLSYR